MDSITIYPPGASYQIGPSMIQLGSYLLADPGPDFGAKGLIQSLESSNALTDGGVFAARYAPPRKMMLPLIINAPYGVNRLVNPDFEAPFSGQLVTGIATMTAVASPGRSFTGSWYLAATVGVASQGAGENALITFQVPVNSLPTNTPMLLAARFKNTSPTIGAAGPAWILGLETPGFTNFVEPDSAAPGYIFGANFGLPPVLNTGNFVGMTLLPNASQWYAIGGILSVNAMASIMGAGSSLSNIQVAAYLVNSAQPSSVPGASYVTAELDAVEFRVADRQRAVREQEAQIREFSTPGAMLRIQPEGVPSSEAVFFDVLDGRWEQDYNVFENRAARRKGSLFLDTQPWGYWPTEILLASSASVGFMGVLPVNGASVIGDVPPMAHIMIAPTSASVYTPSAIWGIDMVAYSLGGRPSFVPLIPPAALYATAGGPTLTADRFSPASQAFQVQFTGGGASDWTLMADTATFISSALEPAYRGRFRAFAMVKRSLLASGPLEMILDADRWVSGLYPAMGSSNQIASVYSIIPSAVGKTGATPFTASPAYGTFDMGEITLPPQGSGIQGGVRLRLWGIFTDKNAPTDIVSMGGIYLVPVDGAAGILTKGLYAPSLPGGSQGALDLNPGFVDSVILRNQASAVYGDGRAQFRGITPRIGASTNQLNLMTGDKMVGLFAATFPIVQANSEYAQVSVSYRPSFQFLYGV